MPFIFDDLLALAPFALGAATTAGAIAPPIAAAAATGAGAAGAAGPLVPTAGAITGETRLSNALFGLQGAQHALRLASFLTPNKQARTTLNLMSMAAGGAANAKDPMALMKSMEGPMGDIAKSTEAGADLQKKRLSEVMPAAQTPPAAFPQPTATRFMRPVRGF